MLTNKSHNLILALHPAKRSLGVCVMEQRGMGKREVLVAGVKTFRGEGKAKQARDYVAQLIRDVEPCGFKINGSEYYRGFLLLVSLSKNPRLFNSNQGQ